MRKREGLLLLGVAVPFVMLLALKFCVTEADQPRVVQHENEAAVEVVKAPIHKAAQPPREGIDAGAPIAEPEMRHRRDKISPLRAGPLLLRDSVAIPRELEAVFTALMPELKSCVADQQTRIEDTLTLRLRFTAQRDGGLGGYSLASTSWQDPYLASCLEDVFAEMHFKPSGLEPGEPRDVELVFSRFTRE